MEKLVKKALRDALRSKHRPAPASADRPKPEKVKEVISQVVAEVDILAWKDVGRSVEVFAHVTDTDSKAAPETVIVRAVGAAYAKQFGHTNQRALNGSVISFAPDSRKPSAWYALVRLTK